VERTLEPEVMDTFEEAAAYDAMDHAAASAAFVDRLIALGAGGRMLDIGTGPGHIPLLCLARGIAGTIVGVDLSRAMLAHAERHRAASPHAACVRYQVADAKRLDFGDASFDSVFSNTILHHIPDPLPFLREANRVRRPGGAFLVRDLFRPATAARARELVDQHAKEASPHQRELFFASFLAALTPDELQTMAAEAGLAGAEVVVDSDRHMSLQIAARSRRADTP
jgi:ubiquinone/menaquinone biosynthesis C-methylase UbiE